MTETLSAVLIVIGGVFLLLGGLGVVRMPDLFMRMQATTKAATLGVGCTLLTVAIHFGDLTFVSRALLVAAFIFLTTPVSAHMIARAAYSVGVPLWEGTLVDEFGGLPPTRRQPGERLGTSPSREEGGSELPGLP